MSGLARLATPFLLMFVLVACGGGDADTPWDSSGTTNDDNTTDSTIVDAYTLGRGSGANFESGELNISVSSLSAGGQTAVIATVADVNGNLYQGTGVSVAFSSECVLDGIATIESPVDLSGGFVRTVYDSGSCTGVDTITAYATVDEVTTTATGEVNIVSAGLGSMQFISSTPESIGLKGFGLVESADVAFKVLDTNGNPVSGELVTFSLNTEVGGISLINQKASTNAEGIAIATVTSGNIPTSVRVTATLVSNPAISTQSDGVIVSTGISDQNSFSLSLSCHSPEAWISDGKEVTASIYAADHFNNPVPDGTAVYFTTEGGQIEPQCLTEDGRCSVVWTSSNPRPSNGRVTILATMLGEESFIDSVPSNGFLDWGEVYTDLSEAFRDDNEDGLYTPYLDEFVDFDSDGEFTPADGLYNGLLCNSHQEDTDNDGELEELLCGEEKNVHVRSSQVLIMARSNVTIESDANQLESNNQRIVETTFHFYGIHDDGSRQVPPGGTKITFEADIGDLSSVSEVIVPCSSGDPLTLEGEFTWLVRWKGSEENERGTLTVTVETEGLTTVSYLDLVSTVTN
ncbi:MAG: Ig-like domain-containing protein [Candidatus Thiodiazotropha sp.]